MMVTRSQVVRFFALFIIVSVVLFGAASASAAGDTSPSYSAGDATGSTANDGRPDSFMVVINEMTVREPDTAVTCEVEVLVNGSRATLGSGAGCLYTENLTINGSSDYDTLTVVCNRETDDSYFTYNSTTSGYVTCGNGFARSPDGSSGGVTVNYTGMDPLSWTGTAANMVFQLPSGTSPVYLTDDGDEGDGESALSGADFENTVFSNPSDGLSIYDVSGNNRRTFYLNYLTGTDSSLAPTSGVYLDADGGGDLVNVIATANYEFYLDGGDQADYLIVDADGQVVDVITTTTVSTITFLTGGFQPIYYRNFEYVNVINEGTATDLVVTLGADPIPNGCAPDSCSLREAIIDSNIIPGHQTITFDTSTTNYLRQRLASDAVDDNDPTTGDLDITGDLTILGDGVSLTVIYGSPDDRVFHVHNGADVTMRDLTITGGRAVGKSGGGVKNDGTLTLEDVAVTGNRTNGGGYGAGIRNGSPSYSAVLTLNRVTISGNSTDGVGAHGGGLNNESGLAILTNTTISGNTASGGGGGVFNHSGMYMNNCTVVNNTATSISGGIRFTGYRLVVKNSIIAGNNGVAGNEDCNLLGTIFNSEGVNLYGEGTGCSADAEDLTTSDPAADVEMTLANNGGPIETLALPRGSQAINAVTDCTTADTVLPNVPGVAVTEDARAYPRPQGDACDIGAFEAELADLVIDKRATPTALPGGLITYTLNVYNLGSAVAVNTIVTDTLPDGVIFDSASAGCTHDGSPTGGIVACNLGSMTSGDVDVITIVVQANVGPETSLENVAFVDSDAPEGDLSNNQDDADTYVASGPEILVVNVNHDGADGSCDEAPDDCTLREAIIAANELPGHQTIIFDTSSPNYLRQILPADAGVDDNDPTTGDLDITDDVTILGDGTSLTIIEGSPADRVIQVHHDAEVTMRDLTITLGRAVGKSGGGIKNEGTLTLEDVAVIGNRTSNGGYGAGIRNGSPSYTGFLTLNRVTISGNTTSGVGAHGGGLNNESGIAVLINTTVSGNTASAGGGGLFNHWAMYMSNSTVVNNTAADGSGGIRFTGNRLEIKNSIVAGNNGAVGKEDCNLADLTKFYSEGSNLYGYGTGCAPSAGDFLTDNPSADVDLVLADNGGPIQTLALPKGSMALDTAGDCTTLADEYLTEDARGYLRPQGDACDIGAYEALLADLTVEKTGPITVTAGEEFTYEITVANRGSATAEKVVITDTLPYGVAFVGSEYDICTESAGVVRCGVPVSLPAGVSFTGIITVTTASDFCYTGKVNNYVEVSSDTPETYVENNSDEWGTVILNNASLTINKALSPDPVTAGGFVSFTLMITNAGPGCATDVTVIDELDYAGLVSGDGNPVGLEMVDYDAETSTQGYGPLDGYWYACGNGVCTRADAMPAGTVDEIVLLAKVPSGTEPGTYTNYADAIWDTGSVTTDVDYDIVADADLGIEKSVIKDNICLGAYGFYELVVENNGLSDAQDVVVTDVLPTGLIFGGGSPECSFDGVSGAVTCSMDALEAGETYDFLVGFNIDDSIVVSGTVINNTASVASATADSNLTNNEDGATFMAVQCFLPPTDMQIEKEMSDPVNAGETVVVTLTVTNNGLHWAEGVTVQDLLYGGMEVAGDGVVISPDPYEWSCDGGLTCVRNNPMAPGTAESIVFEVAIPADWDAGMYQNMAFVTADNPDDSSGTPPNNWDEYMFEVTTEADLSLQKSVLDDEICLDDDASGLYEIVIANNGPSDAENVQVTDVLAAGLEFEGASPECSYDSGSGTVTCTVARLAVGDSRDFMIGVGLDRSVVVSGTTILNEATVTSDTPEGNSGDETDAAEFMAKQCFLPETDLQISKTMSGPVNAGEDIMVTLTITNAGPHWAENVTVQDALYGGMEFIGEGMILPDPLEWSCDGGLTCIRNNPMAPGTSETIYFTVSIPADWEAGTYQNVAFVTSDNPDGLDAVPPNHWAQELFDVTTDASLSIEKNALAGQIIAGGDQVLYSIVVTNNGPSVAYNVDITDTPEAGLTLLGLVKGDLPIICVGDTCTITTLGVGESAEIYARVAAPADTAAGTYDNTACVADTDDTTDNTPVCSTATVQVVAVADLELSKAATPTAIAGELITYTLTVANLGPSDAEDVQVMDTLPDGVSSPTVIGCPSGGVPVCTLGTIAAGDSVTYNIVVTADNDLEPGMSLENTAEVLSSTPDDNDMNNSADADTSIVGLAKLVLTKSGSATAIAGGTINYVLTVENDGGPSVAQSVEVFDTLPDGVSLVSISASKGGCTMAGACILGDVAVGETVTINFVGKVDPSIPAGSTLTNAATLQSDTRFTDDSVTSATWDTDIEASADLSIQKSVIKDDICLGAYGFFEIEVTNNGQSDAQNVVVTDELDDVLIFGGGSPECTHDGSPTGGVVTCALGTVPAGETVDLLIGFNIEELTPAPYPVTNTAEVSSDTADPSSANNSDDASFTAVQCYLPPVDLYLDKEVYDVDDGDDEVDSGGELQFSFLVGNLGPNTAEDVILQDNLLPGLEFISYKIADADKYDSLGAIRVCALGVDGLICTLGAMEKDEEILIEVYVQIERGRSYCGRHANTASVRADNPEIDAIGTHKNTDAVYYKIVCESDLYVDKTSLSADRTVGQEEHALFEIEVTNYGPTDWESAVVISDTFTALYNFVTPQDVTFSGGSPSCEIVGTAMRCEVPDGLKYGETADFLIDLYVGDTVISGTQIVNNVRVMRGDDAYAPEYPDTDQESVEVIQKFGPPVDMVVEKTVTDPWIAGTPGQIVIRVTNNSPHYATGVTVLDPFYLSTLYEGFAQFESDGVTPIEEWGCSAGVTCVRENPMPPYSEEVLVLYATIPADTWEQAGQVGVNHVFVTSQHNDPDTSNNWDEVNFDVETEVDLSIEKSALVDQIVAGGDAVLYNIVVYNDGPSDAYSLVISDTVDTGLVLLELIPGDLEINCVGDECTIPVLKSGESVEIYARVMAPSETLAGDYDNTACVTDVFATHYNLPCSTDTVPVVEAADLAIDKDGPTEVYAGDNFDYVITVYNNGTADALNVVVTDTLPYGTSFVDDSLSACTEVTDGVLRCELGDILAGESVQFSISVYAEPDVCYEGKVNNYVEVSSDTYDPDMANNDDDWGTIIINNTTLTITKTASTVIAGELVEFEITIENLGPGCATDVTVIDELGNGTNPEGLVLVDYSDSSTQAGTPPFDGKWYACSGGASCTRGEPLLANETDVITLMVRVPADTVADTYTNYADVDWDSGSASDTADYVVTTQTDLSIEKSVIKEDICLGAYGIYEIVVTNNGSSDAQNVVVTDDLADILYFGGASPACTVSGVNPATGMGGTVSCQLGTIPAGASVDLMIGFNIWEYLESGTVVDNTATVDTTTPDPVSANDSDSVSFTAVQCYLPPVDLGLEKTVGSKLGSDPWPPYSGQEFRFEFAVTNYGPNTAEDVVLHDHVGAYNDGLEFLYAEMDDPTDNLGQIRDCTLGVDGLICTLGAIGPDEEVTFTVWVKAKTDRDWCGQWTNFATVRADNPEFGSGGASTPAGWIPKPNNDSAEYTIRCVSDLSIDKTALTTDRTVGQEEHVLYEIEVTNYGPSESAGYVIVEDTFTAIHPVEGSQDVTFSGGSPSCQIVLGGTAMWCAVESLAVGETVDFLVDLYVGDTVVSGTLIVNTAEIINGDDIGFPYEDWEDIDEETVEVVQKFGPPVDMAVEKTVTDPWIAGTTGIVTIRVTNNGPHYATGVTVMDPLYLGALYEGFAQFKANGVTPISEWVCDAGVGCVRENPMRPYTTEVLKLYVTLPADVWELYGQQGVNDVYVASQHNDPDTSNNWDRVYFDIETEANLTIDKTALVDEIVAGGDTVLYRILVHNDGPSDAYDVEVTDTVDAGLQLVELIPGDLLMDCTGATCTIPLLPVGGSAEIYVRVLAPTDTLAGNYDNEACVTDTGDTYFNTPCSTATLYVANWADLKILKTATPTVNGGEFISYTLKVYNFGPSLARDLVITDTLPADVKWTSNSSGCAPSGQDAGGFGGIVVCTEPDLAVGDMVQYEIIVWVDPAVEPGTSLENWAEVESITPDPDETNNMANADTSIVGKADLAIVKLDNPDPVVAGEQLEYTVIVTNNGPSYAESVVVVDNLPSELILEEITVAGASAAECDESTCQLGDMAVEQVVTIKIVAIVATDVPTGTVLSNTVRAFTDSVDPNPDNSAWTEETLVLAVSELTVDKTGDLTAIAGEQIAYTIVVGNNGPSDATDVVVTDQFPAVLTNIMVQAFGMPGACGVVGNLMTCNLGDLPVGDTVTIDVLADVLSSALPGPITNVVNVASPEDKDGVSDSHETQIERLADMWIDKSATPTVYGGELITYVLTIENFGPSDARDVVVTDVLPDGVYDVNPGACSLAGMVVTCNAGTIVAGGSTSFTIVVRAEPGLEAGTSLENQASVVSTEPDPNLTNNNDNADTSVVGKADLAVDKSGPATAVAGEQIRYEIVVTNDGPSFAESVVVVDELPTSLKLLDISADKLTAECDDSACQLGDMEVNETVTIEVLALVSTDVLTGTDITNKASAFTDSVDPDVRNNSDSVVTTIQAFADLAVDKSDLNDPVHPTGSVIYEIEVTNNGPSDAQNVMVTDTLGQYLTYTGASPSCTHQSGSNEIVCLLESLASGESVDFLVQAVAGDVPSGTLVYNGVVVTSDTVDLDGQNNSDTEETLVQQNFDESADLSVVKTADRASVVAGEYVTYTIVVENNGPSAAQSVELWENYPSKTEIVDIQIDNPSFENEFCNQLTGLCYLGFVYPEAGYEPVATPVTVTVVLYVHPDYTGNTLTNQVVVFSNMIDKISTNDIDSVTIDVEHQADLEITKVADPNPVVPGERLTYRIEVTNNGLSDAQNVVVTDMLPPELLNARWLPSQGVCNAGVCELGTIPAGGSVNIVIVVDVDPSTIEPIYNEASVDSDTDDPNEENNVADVTVEVTPTADLSITKQDSAPTVNAGDLITYTITVKNDGPSDATNVVVVDTLPEQVTFISAVEETAVPLPRSPEDGCIYDGDRTVTCDRASLAVGETVIYTIVIQTDPDIYIGTSLQNAATVSSDAYDPELADNWDSVDTSIIFSADISITKDGPDRVMAGDVFTFTVTVVNEGPSDVGWVRIKDIYPDDLTVLDVSIEYSGEYEPCECVDTGTGGGSPLCLELKNMEAGEIATISVVVTTDFFLMDEICVENYVEVYDSGPQPDDDLTNNVDTHGVCIYPRYHIFLPLVAGGGPYMPDLVGSFIIEPAKGAYTSADEVVIKAYVTNIGSAPASTYWVDFYIDPDPVPTEPNMPWEEVTGDPHFGISWQVWAPIYPGETIELISEPFDAALQPFGYDVDHTVWPDKFPKGASQLYLFVDSWNPYNPDPPTGVVLESNENNNLYGPIPITVD